MDEIISRLKLAIDNKQIVVYHITETYDIGYVSQYEKMDMGTGKITITIDVKDPEQFKKYCQKAYSE